METDNVVKMEKAVDTKRRVKLAKPFEYEGKTYEEIALDFDGLTGADMIAVESEMTAMGEYTLAPEVSANYQARIAARASGVAYNVILALPLKDFSKVTAAARSFLIE